MTNLELITNAFARKDQKKLWIPQYILDDSELEIKPVITWLHRQLPLGYMIYNDGDKMTGIVLNFSRSKSKVPVGAHMCDMCLQTYSSSQVKMFTYQKTPNHTIGFFVCDDLACEHRIGDPSISKRYSMRETLSNPQKISRYYANVERFFLTYVLQKTR